MSSVRGILGGAALAGGLVLSALPAAAAEAVQGVDPIVVGDNAVEVKDAAQLTAARGDAAPQASCSDTPTEVGGWFAVISNCPTGSGLRIRTTKARLIALGRWMCDKQFQVGGILKSGSAWRSKVKTARCGWSEVYVDFSPNRDFKHNTRFCAKWRELGGAWSTNRACVWIKR